ncbi:putative DNA binding domain-containing protein [Parabacteroides sp. OttesenSCG-928-J18]|nr:putative DNA binding domain-containing protein [Parabacteroides sp. OttesenSCG-928-J18]
MSFYEDKNIEYKSLKKLIGKSAKLSDVADECVAFANAQGGWIICGIEDGETEPPTNQKVDIDEMNKVVARLRSLTDSVGFVNPEVITYTNGGQCFKFQILPTTRTIATTSSGKVFIRIADKCMPVSGEDLTNLAAEKNAFQWELVPSRTRLEEADGEAKIAFLSDIRNSDKVSEFIKQKDDNEILLFYQLITEQGTLTNLGTLWFGTPAQRARIAYPVTAQYIVYNAQGEKIRKKDWHFHIFSPKQLLLDIEKEAVELTYSTEISEGLFRKQIRDFPKEVIRELLINAMAHKRYSVSGDIFIEVYPDKLVITNPGNLPLGITEHNILHERSRRNPHLIQTFHDLNLMEGEGSGYDLIYEKLARDGKQLPVIESTYTKVSVTVRSGVVDSEVLTILDYIDKHFQLTQKEFITLGIIALERKISTTQLSERLQLTTQERLRTWMGSLMDKSIIIARGIKKGTEYLLNPELFATAKLDIIPTLKTIEPFKLEALIEEDLKYNGKSKIAEIQTRLKEVPEKDVQKAIYRMVKNNVIEGIGGKRHRIYLLAKKK